MGVTFPPDARRFYPCAYSLDPRDGIVQDPIEFLGLVHLQPVAGSREGGMGQFGAEAVRSGDIRIEDDASAVERFLISAFCRVFSSALGRTRTCDLLIRSDRISAPTDPR